MLRKRNTIKIRNSEDEQNIIERINEIFNEEVVSLIEPVLSPVFYNDVCSISVITDTVDIDDVITEIVFLELDTPGTEIQIFVNNMLTGIVFWESWYDGCFPNDAFLYDGHACKEYVSSYEDKILAKLTKVAEKYEFEVDYRREDYGVNEWGTSHFWACKERY